MTYLFHPNFTVGALASVTIGQYSNYPMFALSLNTQNYFVNGSVSYSVTRNNFANIGIGAVIGRNPFQLHIICDNVLAANLANVQKTNIRFGFNFQFGNRLIPRKKKLNEISTVTEKDAGAIISKEPINPQVEHKPSPGVKAPLNMINDHKVEKPEKKPFNNGK
jgi:hypothetical protein